MMELETTDLPTTPAVDPEVFNVLQSITDEQGRPKYGDLTSAVKALAAAQAHIKNIETENAEYRNKTLQAKTMDDLFNALKDATPPASAPAADTTAPAPAPAQGEDPDLESVISALLTKREQEKSAKEIAERRLQNQKEVASALVAHYGSEEKAQEALYGTIASDLGLSKEEILDLAGKSPKAILKVAGVGKAAPVAPLQGLRTEGLPPPSASTETRKLNYNTTADLVSAWKAVHQEVLSKQG
jgi:hypothetical protein